MHFEKFKEKNTEPVNLQHNLLGVAVVFFTLIFESAFRDISVNNDFKKMIYISFFPFLNVLLVALAFKDQFKVCFVARLGEIANSLLVVIFRHLLHKYMTANDWKQQNDKNRANDTNASSTCDEKMPFNGFCIF